MPAPIPGARARPYALPALWLSLFLVLYIRLKTAFGTLICDDAYITLSHARSFLLGLGAVMSAENPVSATSTPLFTLLVAVAAIPWALDTGAAGAAFERAAFGLNQAFDALSLCLVYRLSRSMGAEKAWALLAAGTYGSSLSFLAVSAQGMETPLYVCLLLGGADLLFRGRSCRRLAAVCLLLPLVRPEGVLFPAVAVLWKWRAAAGDGSGSGPWAKARQALPCMLAGGAGLLLFLLFYRLAYGEFLPHSITAKSVEIDVGIGEALRSWILNVFYKGPVWGGLRLTTAFNLLVLGFAAAGFCLNRREGPPFRLLIWPVAYVGFFLVTGTSHVLFTWYYLPVLPFLILFLTEGMRRLPAPLRPGYGGWIAAFCLPPVWAAQMLGEELPKKHRMAWEAREGRYREAAAILDSTGPGTAMIDEVGALGFYSRQRILDTHGLLSPEAVPFLRRGWGQDRLWVALKETFGPDWILVTRPAQEEGRRRPGEVPLYEGYVLQRKLYRDRHPYVLELWRKETPILPKYPNS